MAQKEVSIKDYTVDREYASHITLEEFVSRIIRSHADSENDPDGKATEIPPSERKGQNHEK